MGTPQVIMMWSQQSTGRPTSDCGMQPAVVRKHDRCAGCVTNPAQQSMCGVDKHAGMTACSTIADM